MIKYRTAVGLLTLLLYVQAKLSLDTPAVAPGESSNSAGDFLGT